MTCNTRLDTCDSAAPTDLSMDLTVKRDNLDAERSKSNNELQRLNNTREAFYNQCLTWNKRFPTH